MKLCVRDAFTSYEYLKEYSFLFDKSQISDFPNGAETDSVSAEVTIETHSGKVMCTMHVSAVFTTVCSRCASEYRLPLEFTVTRQICETDDGQFEDVIYTDGSYCFDIADEIRTQIYFEFPAKTLCREDCKGLCPVCGCDLNNGSCSCDIRTVDPRLAVLKNLKDND